MFADYDNRKKTKNFHNKKSTLNAMKQSNSLHFWICCNQLVFDHFAVQVW